MDTNLIKENWRGGNGKPYSLSDIVKIIRENPLHDIHIGTDSHIKDGKWQFAVAVCLHGPGRRGTRYFFRRFKVKKDRLQTLGVRLQKEVETSLEVASILLAVGIKTPVIHADTSTDPSQKSFQHTSRLRNWIQGMGYECLTKPFAWASGSVADRHAK